MLDNILPHKQAFFSQQIHFISSLKTKAIVAFALGCFLSFVIIFLEPFNTNNFESSYRYLALLGFGAVMSVVLLIHSMLENIWYKKVHNIWRVSYEIISILIFIIISGSLIFLYSHLLIDKNQYSLHAHYLYFKHFISVMIPVIIPFLLYLRQKLGVRIIPIPPNTIIINGKNKHELLKLKKHELLYIKAIENYIEIFYLNADKSLNSITFRQTLSHAQQELPFLEKCHRSYLVNPENIKNIEGNSQTAKISLQHTTEKIPLSKVLYKDLKERLRLKRE